MAGKLQNLVDPACQRHEGRQTGIHKTNNHKLPENYETSKMLTKPGLTNPYSLFCNIHFHTGITAIFTSPVTISDSCHMVRIFPDFMPK